MVKLSLIENERDAQFSLDLLSLVLAYPCCAIGWYVNVSKNIASKSCYAVVPCLLCDLEL